MRSITGGGLKSGLPPGSLIHVGIASEEEAQLTVIKFNPDSLHEVELVKPFNLESCIEGDTDLLQLQKNSSAISDRCLS